MAHNLRICKDTASMMYVGEAPWHGLGTKLDRPATSAEAIAAARLDWEVMKWPVYVDARGKRVRVPRKHATVMRDEAGQIVPLGIVGRDYQPLQNREAFAFLDSLVVEGAAIYHTAGALGRGERVWVLAQLPGELHIAPDDPLEKYLLLSNCHDGCEAVRICLTPVRVVCQNTLSLALSRSTAHKVRHVRGMQGQLREKAELLGVLHEEYEALGDTCQRLAQVGVDDSTLAAYAEAVFPLPKREDDHRGIARATAYREAATRLFHEGTGLDRPGVRGTLWAAFNSVTELIDHGRSYKDRAARLKSTCYGEGARVKRRAWDMACQWAAQLS